jgi:hypothetical protein
MSRSPALIQRRQGVCRVGHRPGPGSGLGHLGAGVPGWSAPVFDADGTWLGWAWGWGAWWMAVGAVTCGYVQPPAWVG